MKHSAIILVFRAYALIVQLAISLALARIFEAQGYGRWGLLLGLAQWGYTFFLAWNTLPLTRFGREEYLLGKTLQTTFTSRTILLVPSLLLLILTAFLSSGLISRAIHSSPSVTWIILGYVIAFLFSETFQYILPAIGRADLTAPMMAMERTLILGLMVLLYRFGLLNPITALAAFAGMTFFVNACLLMRYRAVLGPWRWNREVWRRYWFFSRPLIIAIPFGGIIGWIDLFVINHFGSLEDVGVYFLSYQIYNAIAQIGFVISLIAGPFMVLMALKKRDDLADLLANRLSWFALGFGIGIVFFITPPAWFAVRFVAPTHAAQVMTYWLLLAPSAIFGFTTLISANYYVAREAMMPLTLMNGLGMVVNVIVDLLLIPVYGPLAAALATTMGQMIVFLAYSLHQRSFGLYARFTWLRILMAFLPSTLLFLMMTHGIAAVFGMGLLGGGVVMTWVAMETRSLLRYRTVIDSPGSVSAS